MHRETTENIRVTVIPFYMGMRVGLCYILLFCDLFNLYVWGFFCSKACLLTESIFCLLEKSLFGPICNFTVQLMYEHETALS